MKGLSGTTTDLGHLQKLLLKSKEELEDASLQIKSLKDELRLQQQHFDKQSGSSSIPLPQDNDNYKLRALIDVKTRALYEAEAKLKEVTEEKESAA